MNITCFLHGEYSKSFKGTDFMFTRKIKNQWNSIGFYPGAAEGIRTPDRSVRSRLLYPAELPLLNLIILT